MRNRIAHGYFDINLDVVWDTVQTALPDLLKQLSTVRQDTEEEDDYARASTQEFWPKSATESDGKPAIGSDGKRATRSGLRRLVQPRDDRRISRPDDAANAVGQQIEARHLYGLGLH